ncbi:MAG: hypothetical protein ACOX3H_09760 [Saccharofermentanales bacterium]|jgi:hypothetical protein
MLEILGIILLCNVNKKNALARGRKPGGFIALTICLWLGLEFLGAFIGGAANLGLGTYGLAIGMAVIGAIISYFAAKNCKPGNYVPPAQTMMQNNAPNVEPFTVSEPSQMQYAAMPYPGNEQVMQTAFCHKCGAPLIEGAFFCGDCGQQRFVPVQTANARAPMQNNDAVPFMFNSEESVPCTVKPMRAVWTAVWLISAWIMFVLFHSLLGFRILYCNAVSYMIIDTLLGTGIYLLMQKGGKYKALASGVLVITVLIYILNFLLLYKPMQTGVPFRLENLFRTPFPPMIIVSILLRTLVAAGGALFFAWLLRQKSVSDPGADGTAVIRAANVNVEKKRVWLTALYTALVSLLIHFVYTLITSPFYLKSPTLLLQFLFNCLLTAVTLFLTPPVLHELSAMRTKYIRLTGWGLVWCWLCAIGLFFSLVMSVVSIVNATAFFVRMYSSQLFMSIALLTGFIMLLARRRLGWYVILFGSYIALAGQFDDSLDAVINGVNLYIPLLIGTVLGALNPLITWLSIRGAWRREFPQT